MDDTPRRPSFLIYKSFYKPIKNLSYEDKGKLFDLIFKYQTQDFDGIEQVMEPQIEMAFEFYKNQFELDNKKWEKRVAAQKANGKKGGRPKKASRSDQSGDQLENKPTKPKVSDGLFNILTEPKKGVKEIEKEIEKEKENEIEIENEIENEKLNDSLYFQNKYITST